MVLSGDTSSLKFDGFWYGQVPHYSTDHNAAVLVVQAMGKLDEDDQRRFALACAGIEHWSNTSFGALLRVVYETTPEIICRAALRTLDEREKQNG